MKALAFVAIALLSSCTLYMDDIDLPEDQRGFEEPVFQSNELGTYEYQFNENVKSIASNVLEYISYVEADSIIYYYESVPESMLPKEGEFVSAQVSSKIRKGLNHKVLSVQNVGGMYKVTTTKAELGDIFKTWKLDYAFDLKVPVINSMDSTERAELGITDEEFTYEYWGLYNKICPDDTITTRSTRYVELVDDTYTPELTINVLDIEATTEGHPFIKNLSLIKKIESFFGGDVKLIAKAKYVHPMTIKIFAEHGFTIGFCAVIDVKSKPYWDTEFGIGISKVDVSDLYGKNDEELEDASLLTVVKEGLDLIKKNKRDAATKITPDLPSFKIALGPSGLFAIIEPRFGFNMNCSVMGTVQKRFYLDESEMHVEVDDWSYVKSKSYSRKTPSSYNSSTTFGLAGSFGMSVSGGIGVGLSILGVADAQFTFDLEGGFDAQANIFETSDFTGATPIVNMDSYTPSKNNIEFWLDFVFGFQLKALKKKWSWPIGKLRLLSKKINLFPSIDDFVFEKRYNPVTGLINGGTAHIKLNDIGIIPHRYGFTNLGVAVLGRAESSSTQPEAHTMDCGFMLAKDHEYIFDVDLPELAEGYEICPMLSPKYGRDVIINGTPIVAPGDLNAFEIRSHKMTLNCSHQMKFIVSQALRDYIRKRYKDKIQYFSDMYYYNWQDEIDLIGGPNIQKWGVKVIVGSHLNYMSSTKYEKEIVIEDATNKPISSGKKKLMFDFITDEYPVVAPGDFPYVFTVKPFYVDGFGEKHYMHSKHIDVKTGAEKADNILKFSGTSVGL